MPGTQDVVREKFTPRGGIIVVDDDTRRRASVVDRLRFQFGNDYEVRWVEDADGAASLITSIVEEEGIRVPVIAISVNQAESESFARSLSRRVESKPKMVVYGDDRMPEPPSGALVDACVVTQDIEGAVYGVLLGSELEQLNAAVPIAAEVVDTVDVNLGVLNPRMEVLWENKRAASTVHEAHGRERVCSRRYHGFLHRESACPGCEAGALLDKNQKATGSRACEAGGSPMDCHLLPIHGKIERVEFNHSPVISRDGARTLALIKTSRIVTSDWEKTTPAHERLRAVVAAARLLGRHRRGTSPFLAVSVYYQPDKDADLHLFDSARAEGTVIPKVIRLDDRGKAYRDAMEDRQPQFYDDSLDGQTRRHFVWADRTASMERMVVVDVVYGEAKPDPLLTEDLAPYWRFLAGLFDAAWEARENMLKWQLDSAVQEFLARMGVSTRDEADLDSALEIGAECIVRAVGPLSMHVRVLDRRKGTLVMRRGFGPYSEMAPEERVLVNEGIGSSWAASQRKSKWNRRADLAYIRQCLERELTADEQRGIELITSDVLIPLECMDRVLGTLCMQFDDDSLYSPAKCRFVEALGKALSSVLGTREWANQRGTIIECARSLDGIMFRRSERPDEEEVKLLKQVAGMAFELSAAEVVAYYRYDPQCRTLTLVAEATQGTPPPGTALPELIPPDVGVVSRAAGEGQGYWVRDYQAVKWQGIRRRLFAAFRDDEPKDRFCRSIGSEVAEPVIAGETMRGVLVAFSSIPRWLGADDVEVVREFAGKTGRCLEAKQLTRQLNWNLRTKASLNEITAAMARVSDVSTGYRHLLLAITADECLGFSRAILFVRRNGHKNLFVATEAVGACSQAVAHRQWKEAESLSLSDKMAATARRPPVREGDLLQRVSQLTLNLEGHPEILASLQSGKMAIRRCGQTHLLHDVELLRSLYPDDGPNVDYIAAPLVKGGELTGVVLVDRAFLFPTDISSDRIDLLQFLMDEYALMLEAIRLRREEEATQTAMELTRGVNYSLRTRSAALEARISNLAHKLGGAHQDSIDGLKQAILFFKRVGTIAAKFLEWGKLPPGEEDCLDVNDVVAQVVDDLDDARITLHRANVPLRVRAVRHYLDDVFWEILWNACEFADRKKGEIVVSIRREGDMVRVDFVDNGPGIHPEFRPNLFKPFKCFPASRMGLGLSYVAGLVERYGGTIRETGTWGRGAHFEVRLSFASGENDD